MPDHQEYRIYNLVGSVTNIESKKIQNIYLIVRLNDLILT